MSTPTYPDVVAVRDAASQAETGRLLSVAIQDLHPEHQAELRKILVPPHSVSVQASPGESVFVVAKRGDLVLYWSDVEEGWEGEQVEEDGSLKARGCNQFKLREVAYQIFGDPVAK